MQRSAYWSLVAVFALANAVISSAAHGGDAPASLSLPNVSVSPGTPPGKPLTLDDAVRLALENHSNIKSAAYQTQAQDAVVRQRMSAYYPTVTLNNAYRTNKGEVAVRAGDTLSTTANVNMILYNFGKREGTVQAARETREATQYAYTATSHDTVLAAKEAYYGVLQANALLNVNEETVRDRQATLKQTQSFYDVGTKPRSDVTQAEANLYLAEANLISARKDVEVAWATLKTALGVDDLPKQPLAEDLVVAPFPLSLEQSREEAFANRPELLQLAASLRSLDQTIAVRRRNHLPDISVRSSFGEVNVQTEIFRLRPTWLVQLSVDIPIFNGFQTTYEVQESINNYRSTKEQERVQRQQVALEVEQNYLTLAASRDTVRANEAAVRAAKENLDLHEARYQVGYAAIVEVTNAQITYTTAQTNYVNSLIAYKITAARLVNAIGRQ